MSLIDLKLDTAKIDQLILSWVNSLTPVQLAKFNWTYTRPGKECLTLSLGESIVRQRLIKPFSKTDELLTIPGFSEDSLTDLRIFAKEAIALADYKQTANEPELLWESLCSVGKGLSLASFLNSMKNEILRFIRSRTPIYKNFNVLLKIPFIALETGDENRDQMKIEQFVRVRLEPWAIKAHDDSRLWTILVKYDNKNIFNNEVFKGRIIWQN